MDGWFALRYFITDLQKIGHKYSNLILINFIISSFCVSCGDSADNGKFQPQKQAVSVMTQPVKFATDTRTFQAVGTGRARKSVDIYPSVNEEVVEILFNSQDRVNKGDVLVQLDDRDEALQLRLAEVRLDEAKRLLTRYEEAVKEGAVPQSEVDSARADVESAKVELDDSKLAMQDRKIIAPISGVVGIPRIDPGDRVSTDTLITGLDDRGEIFVDFEVPESLAGIVKNNLGIKATTPAYPEKIFTGIINSVESRIDSKTRTIMVRASIDNSLDLLRPGMSFTTTLKITGDSYPVVPEIALQWSSYGAFVWIVRNNKAHKVQTKVISRTAGSVLIQGDIKEGELLVVEGLERLDEGTMVSLLQSEIQPPTNQKGNN